MIPLTILYHEYIGRPKLTEQKKNPVEYIVPPSPLKWGSEKLNKAQQTSANTGWSIKTGRKNE